MEPIEEECESLVCELQEFVNRQQQVIMSETMSFRKAKAEIEAECSHLMEMCQRHKEHLSEHENNKNMIENTMASLEEQMGQLKLEAEVRKPQDILSFEERSQQIKQQTEMAKENLRAKEEGLKVKENVLQKGIENFQRVLGMTLSHSPETDTLSIAFTKIDKQNPDRVFSFDLVKDSGDCFQVVNTNPFLSNNQLADLQGTLKDKSFIIQSVRRIFKSIASA